MSDFPPPPRYGPPPAGEAYGSRPEFRKVGGMARAIVPLVGIAASATVLSTIFTVAAREDARDFAEGRIDEDAFIEAYAPAALLDVVGGALTIAIAVLTMIWMFRMAQNLRMAGLGTRWAPGWGIGAWFVPPFLFIVPFLMLRELWKASAAGGFGSPDDWRQRQTSPWLWVWWVTFGLVPILLVPFAVSSAIQNINADAQDVAKGIVDQLPFTIMGSVSSIIAAIAYAFVVRLLTNRHQEFTGGS